MGEKEKHFVTLRNIERFDLRQTINRQRAWVPQVRYCSFLETKRYTLRPGEECSGLNFPSGSHPFKRSNNDR